MPTITRWTGNDLCALQGALGLTNERFAERLTVAVRTLATWRTRGHQTLPDLAQRVLPSALANCTVPVRERFDALVVRGVSRHADALDDTIGAAADEVDADRLVVAADFDPTSVESLWAESRSVAHANNRSALEIFTAAQRVRKHAHDLAERTRRPAVLSDLYVIIGQVTALMASTAFDLNRWDAAETLARSARTYASMAGDPALEAWVLGLEATLANWRNEPDMAVALYERGISLAPEGEPRFRLRHIASRSYALLGDVETVRQVLGSAESDRDAADAHPDSLSQQVGGEFSFGDARADACAAAAWLDVAAGGEAEQRAQRALDHLSALPRPRQPFSQVAGTQLDIVSARLLTGNLDGAGAMLAGVLELPDRMRNVSLAGRMARIRDELHAMNDDGEVGRLLAMVETWLREADSIRAQEVSRLPR